MTDEHDRTFDLRVLEHGLQVSDEVLRRAPRCRWQRTGTGPSPVVGAGTPIALHGLPIGIEAGDLPALPAAVEVAAYRIVMEALTNVARHSGATRAEVSLRVGDDCLTIDISDNGNAGGEWVPGIGLTSMRERASELGGTVTYRGTPTGSTVSAELPLGASRGTDLHGG